MCLRDRAFAVAWRIGVLVTAALLAPRSVQADTEWQIRPYMGVTFGGGTTLLDLDFAASKPNVVFGVSGGLLGEVVGIEADFGHAPGFFQGGDPPFGVQLVSKSSVLTFTGNVIVGPPRRRTEYTLRPYFVGGFGLMRASTQDSLSSLPVSVTRPAFDLGGGVGGALSDRIGLSWELRHFRSFGADVDPRGQSSGPEKLSFWRANMALVIRY